MFEQIITIPACIGDSNSKLPIGHLFDYMINIGTLHVESENLSTKELLEKNLTWMIYQVKIKIKYLPQIGSQLRLRTWISKVDKLKIYRQVELRDLQENILVVASFVWLLVDTEKMRVTKATKEIKKLVEGKQDNLDLEFTKFKDMDAYDQVFTRPIYKSDIDYNKHVHSGAYLRWLTDYVDLDNDQLREFEIYFKDQVLAKDQLEILQRKEGPAYFFQVNKNGQGAVYAKSLWGTKLGNQEPKIEKP